MAWGAIAAAAIGGITGIIQGQQQRSAADAQNKEQEKIAKAQYKRDKKEWKIDRANGWRQHAWNLADVEAQRYIDRVRREDYEAQQTRVIDSALENLELNIGALRDQYIESEKLRAIQERNALADGLGRAEMERDRTLDALGFQAAESILKTGDDIAGYLNRIKLSGQQGDLLLAKKQAEGQQIQEQIVINEQLDTLQRDAEYVTALAESADAKAGATARQGGSNSSRAVALDSMKAFGRSYGLLKTEQRKRRNSLNNYNASLAGETASQMARIATEIEGDMRSINYSRNANALTLASLASQGEVARKQYTFETNSLMRNFNELTRPGFDLARRQGEREFKALVTGTINTIKGASTPFREAIIFDPLEPIAGLKPEKMKYTKAAKPGWGSILLGAGIQAAQGAMSQSYTDSSGNLAFR